MRSSTSGSSQGTCGGPEREQKTISLNEAVRRAERDRLEAQRKQRQAERAAAGLDTDAFDRERPRWLGAVAEGHRDAVARLA